MGKYTKRLRAYDTKAGITKKAFATVEERIGHVPKRHLGDDFGRALPYYAPVYSRLVGHLGDMKGKNIAHVGGSTGVLARYLKDMGANAVSLDKGVVASKVAKSIGSKAVIADARRLPLRKASLDAFVSDHFLLAGYGAIDGDEPHEHFYDRPQAGSMGALKDLAQAMRPGAVGIFTKVYLWPVNRKRVKSDLRAMGFEIVEWNLPKKLWTAARGQYGTVVVRKKG